MWSASRSGAGKTASTPPQPGLRPSLAKALQISIEELHALLYPTDEGERGTGLFTCLPESALRWRRADLSPHDEQLARLLQQLDAADGGDGGATPLHREVIYAQLVEFLVGWAHTMNRRELLRILGWAATTAAGAPVLDEHESERLTRAIQAPRRIDGRVIEHIEAVLWHCTKQDDLLGPQATLDTVLAQRSLARSLLPGARTTIHARLLATFGALSRLAGWLSFNLDHYDAAACYYESARQAAHEARDTDLAAFVLANMAWVATDRGQARVAIDHAANAQRWADQTDDLRLRAYAWDALAKSQARDGQTVAAFEAIEKALDLLREAEAGRPSYAYWLNGGGRLDWTETRCRVYLGDHERGAEAAEHDRAAVDPSRDGRTYARVTLALAECRLRVAKPDVAGAALALGEAAALAVRNGSPRLMAQVRGGVAALEPWRDVPEVRSVRQELAAHALV